MTSLTVKLESFVPGHGQLPEADLGSFSRICPWTGTISDKRSNVSYAYDRLHRCFKMSSATAAQWVQSFESA